MIKDKIFECFDEYVEKRHDEMGSDYTRPDLSDMLDQAHEPIMRYYKIVEFISDRSDIAEKETAKFERGMIEKYLEKRHDEKVREIRENIADRRERYRTEQSLKAGKV